MNVLYHLPILPPALPNAEALSQEIAALQTEFPGEIVYLNPNQTSPIYLPRLLFGWSKLRQVRAFEVDVDLHHFFNPDPYAYPVLRAFRRPVVYSLSSGLGDRRPNLSYFSQLAAVTVYDEASYRKLSDWGLTNVHLVCSGIDAGRFTHTPQQMKQDIRLLVASAPWTEAQFQSKGVDALLAAAQQMPRLHLTFLWRGVLFDEMAVRVKQAGLVDRVQVINQQVDVNQALADVHGAVNLATDGAIIKAYPHSLMDSLAAGKPVIVSRAIAMSADIVKYGCGVVVNAVTADGLLAAIDEFADNYDSLAAAAICTGQQEYAQSRMINSFRDVYVAVVP